MDQIVKAAPVVSPDYEAIKKKQQATWASGDFAVVGTTLQIVGESLAEEADVRSGELVLDVAAGNGNATLAAARRFAQVTSTDYVPALLEKGAKRAAAEGLPVHFQVADVEALPFVDGVYDVVLSTFGCMFAPNHARTAREMLRVTRSGGRIGMANWTPNGFIGRLFKVIGKHIPPAPGPAIAGALGHGRAPREALRQRGRAHPGHPPQLQLPLPLGRALGAHLPRVLRPDAQGVRRARREGTARARSRHPRAPRRAQHRRPEVAGRAERVPRSRHYEALRRPT
jgi:SAM-dependent methyltransferase